MIQDDSEELMGKKSISLRYYSRSRAGSYRTAHGQLSCIHPMTMQLKNCSDRLASSVAVSSTLRV